MRYILIPITMFLWFLTTYYGLCLAVFGMVYIVSLHWIWILIGYPFLIGILFGISNSIPALLRLLILKIYGINWFSCIVHSLAGALGAVNFFAKLPLWVLVNEQGTEVSFFTVMWKMAPLKIIICTLPFAGIVISLLYSTIIFPISFKFKFPEKRV